MKLTNCTFTKSLHKVKCLKKSISNFNVLLFKEICDVNYCYIVFGHIHVSPLFVFFELKRWQHLFDLFLKSCAKDNICFKDSFPTHTGCAGVEKISLQHVRKFSKFLPLTHVVQFLCFRLEFKISCANLHVWHTILLHVFVFNV